MADLVAGRYRIIELLGEGGMGEVYSAHDERLKRHVAIKRLHVYGVNKTQLETFHARFEREAISMAQFIHPYIVPVYDFGSDEEGVYLVMGLMTGGSLKERMGTIMPVKEAAKMIIPIANALGYVHSHKIVHRDVKPHNILFNEHDVPMISDFGIVKLVESDGVNLTSTGTGVGTPAYMAPEQMTTKIDARADQYSLGIILYEMLTGRIPFEGETPVMTLFLHRTEPLPDPRLFAPTLSDKTVEVLRTALAKNPDHRYPNMNAFATALQEAAEAPELNVLDTDAGFVQTSVEEKAAENSPALNQTMIGEPSLFTKESPEEAENDENSQSLEEFIRESDEFQVDLEAEENDAANTDDNLATTVNPIHLNGTIQQAFDVPMDENIEENSPKEKKHRKKKERGEKRKRRIPKWIVITAPILVVLCLLMVLMQRCANLGETLEMLSLQGSDQPIEEILDEVGNEISNEFQEDLGNQEPYVPIETEPQELLIIGDPGMQAAIEIVAEEFRAKYPDWDVTVAGGGSVTALTAIASDKADIGMSRLITTELDWDRFPSIYPIPIALNPMGVICNPQTEVTDLMLDDLRRILSGEIDNWDILGGPDAPIRIYVADFDDEATMAFASIVMGEDLVTDQIEFVGTPEQVVKRVKDDPNGIGILNHMVETGSIQYISINGVEPNDLTVRNGRYKLVYELLLITHDEPDEKENIFLDFLFSPQGARIISQHGLIPIKLEDLE